MRKKKEGKENIIKKEIDIYYIYFKKHNWKKIKDQGKKRLYNKIVLSTKVLI